MGKRSNFEKIEKDYYETPYEAIISLLPYLNNELFLEPCAGNGKLINHLEKNNHKCIYAADIEPKNDKIIKNDALIGWLPHIDNNQIIITNPPWSRYILHPMIKSFSFSYITWLLFDADWMHTKQSSLLIKQCELIISIGRLKWIPNSTMVGKDNCCWYKFKPNYNLGPKFIGR